MGYNFCGLWLICENWENYTSRKLPAIRYTFVIQSHKNHDVQSFQGAPKLAFSGLIHIIPGSEQANQTWLEKMMQASLCTYRGLKPKRKHVLRKATMHCQHFRKPLISMQATQSKTVGSKWQMKPMKILDRQKKTASFNTQAYAPSATYKQKQAATKHPSLLTHSAVLQLQFFHNHPINAAHPLTFWQCNPNV